MINRFMQPFRIMRGAALSLAVTAMALTMLTSCNDDDYSNVSQPAYSVMATLKSNGQGSVYTYRTGETTPLVTVTSKITLDTAYHVSPGDRLVIYFDIEGDRTIEDNGPIDLRMITRVFNDTIRNATPEIISSWSAAPVSGTQLCRRGNYIDAWAFVPVPQQQPRYLHLFVDEASIADGRADMYLTLSEPNFAPGQSALVYSSFHLEKFLRAHPDVTTFRIHVAGAQSVDPIVELRGITLLDDFITATQL